MAIDITAETVIERPRGEVAAYVVDPANETKWIGGAGVSLLWWTFLGKVEVGAEAGTEGDKRLIVALGPDF